MRAFALGVAASLVLAAVWQAPPTLAQATVPVAMAEGMEFKDGDRYWIPMNSETNSLALFSESLQVVTFYNKTSAEHAPTA